MGEIIKDFIAEDNRKYKFKIGQLVASSLTGFIFGVIAASIIWMVAFKYFQSLAPL